MKMPRVFHGARSSFILDCLLVFLLTAILIYPLFKVKYLDNWGSIDSTFIADARLLKENFPHPGWQPYWYCGTRWDYIYPPALRYGTAVLSTVLPIIPARAYHMYTALYYCLGMVGVYLLVRLGSGSRRAAWICAAAVATLSPIFLFVPEVRRDAGTTFHLPQRLSVLLRWGEGPHISALSMLGIALACSLQALRRWNPVVLACAALTAALVVSNNFYGATALAFFFPVMVWSVWLGRRDRLIWLRAAAIAVLAYGLTAFWLTLSYLQITTQNMQYVSRPGKTWCYAVGLVFVAVVALVTWKRFRNRPELDYAIFVFSGFAFISLYVLGEHFFQFRVFGEPTRLMPEFDLFFLLAAGEILRRLWLHWPESKPTRLAIAGLVCAAFLGGVQYVTHAWKIYDWDGGWKGRIEYRLTEWMHQNMPNSRALAAGSIRFWYNAWFNGQHVGGGSEQGLLNGILYAAQWDLFVGEDRDLSILWLQATGTDAAIVSDQTSKEIYHDYVRPQKFEGLPILHDNGSGDRIYRVPRRFPGIARVVETGKASALRPIAGGGDTEGLRAYVAVVENGPDAPADSVVEKLNTIRVQANVAPGQSVLVMENFDPCWRAYSANRPLPIRKDAMGFMLVDTPPGAHDIRLVFETPLENRVGRVVSGMTLCVVLLLLFGLRRREA